MKKFLLIISILASTITASAEITGTVTLEDIKAQTGTVAEMKIMMTNSTALTGVQFHITLPEGITPVLNDDNTPKITCEKSVTIVTSLNGQDVGCAFASASAVFAASDESVQIGTLFVNVPSNIASYTLTLSQIEMCDASLNQKSITGTDNGILTAQRAAVIEPMGTDYAFEIIPFALTSGQNDMAVLMKNKLDVASYKLTVEYPTGIAAYKSGRSYATPTVINDNLYSKTDASITALSMATAFNTTTNVTTYSVTNTANDTYLPTTSFVKAFTLPINVTATDPGVYNIKVTVSDIVAYDSENDPDFNSPISIIGGEYMVSAFLGTPTETDPIVYGHYTTEGQAALKAAATNFASIDMSAATVDAAESAVASDLSEKLIYGPAKTSYNRTVTGYGTVCLPFELTSVDGIQYYSLSKASSSSLTFEEVSTVPANTPALVKGTISASINGYQYASAPVTGATANGLTMKGTYEKKLLKNNTQYYINNNAFWNDCTESEPATIAPFRGYFEGTPAASKLSIFISDATGIHEITNQLSNEDIYNLQGIKLNKAQKGVNIIGGKKVLVK